MRLDDLIFEEVAMALGAGETEGEELRQRRAPRYAVDARLTIQPYGAARTPPREVQLRDISACGLCIIDHMTVSAGDRFVTYLPRVGGATIDVICTVRQSRLSASGGFRVGAEFTSEMDARTRLVRGVDGLTNATTVAKPQPEEATRPLSIPAQIHDVTAGPGQTGFPAEIQEASGLDIALVTQKALAAGDQFVLEFVMGKRRSQRWLCAVTHVAMMDRGKYRAKAKIITPREKGHTSGGIVGWFRRLF